VETNDIISSGLLELYVLGMTSEQETAQVKEMAARNPEVLAEIRSIETALQSYARLYAVQPADHIKNSLFSKLPDTASKTNQPAPVVTISSFWKYAAAASILLLVGSIVMNVNYYRKI
jgi:anti-sigma-K factor RskA